jgi:hypothetical protein
LALILQTVIERQVRKIMKGPLRSKALSRNKGDSYCADIVSDCKAHPMGHSSCAMFRGWNAESWNEIKQELLPLFIDGA